MKQILFVIILIISTASVCVAITPLREKQRTDTYGVGCEGKCTDKSDDTGFKNQGITDEKNGTTPTDEHTKEKVNQPKENNIMSHGPHN